MCTRNEINNGCRNEDSLPSLQASIYIELRLILEKDSIQVKSWKPELAEPIAHFNIAEAPLGECRGCTPQ